ncbi:hypothetical protein BH23CYA1_BH23CYA1_23810 [soil metagenome]
MDVEIDIFLSDPPDKVYIDSLTTTALNCTNAKKSVRAEGVASVDNYVVTVKFTMKTAAQYKVVDGICRAFKSKAWDYEGYRDMTIRFP